MSTNPNNAIGTNGAYGGRTSVEAFNDVLNTFGGAGILSGWECSPSSGMTIALGGVTGYRDVAVAAAPGGAKTTVNNRTSNAIEITLDSAPSSNSRIDVIVAYVANPPQGSSSTVDNPGACGIIAVKGTVAASPTAPTESAIRTAITADGAAGSTAYYVVLATIRVLANVTTITGNYITQGSYVGRRGNWVKVGESTLTSDTSGNSFFEVAIPSEFQGANCSYQIECAGEVEGIGSAVYPYLNAKIGGSWAGSICDYAFFGYREYSVQNYGAIQVNPFGVELQYAVNNDHCVMTADISRAGSGNYWCVSGRVGGVYNMKPFETTSGGGIATSGAIQALRIYCDTNITLLAGSHLTVWARKY